MHKITNHCKRTVALPAPKLGAVVLSAGMSLEVSDEHFKELTQSLYTSAAINGGAVEVTPVKPKKMFNTKQKASK